MPIPFRTVPIIQLLHHEAAYNLINISGHLRYENWDIVEFEKGLLGCYGSHYYSTHEEEQELLRPLMVLDHIMPFCASKKQDSTMAMNCFCPCPINGTRAVAHSSGHMQPGSSHMTSCP